MIDPHIIFLKTEKGETEFSTRTYKLNHALRYVLILVNGKATVSDIQGKGAGLCNIEEALGQLAAQGFIQTTAEQVPQTHASTQSPKHEIIALAKSLLGTDAGPVIRKLQEAADTPEALTQATTACRRLIKLAIDAQKADDFNRHAQEIIYSSALRLAH